MTHRCMIMRRDLPCHSHAQKHLPMLIDLRFLVRSLMSTGVYGWNPRVGTQAEGRAGGGAGGHGVTRSHGVS